MTRSLLFLSYLFPPRGGAGVQRALKFAKYLPRCGWRPLVVANDGVAGDDVTCVQDPTLLRDLPDGAVVRYTCPNRREQKRFDRMQSKWRRRLAARDPMAWWVGPAVRTALQLLCDHCASAIFVTMSPFSSAEAGIRLKQITKLPLILDLRDPWALDETKMYPTRWHAWRDWAAMTRALLAADLVIMNTPEAAQAVEQAMALPTTTRIISLTNGYDAEEFPPEKENGPRHRWPSDDVLRIVHTGMFHGEQAEVWDRLRSPRGWMDRAKFAHRPIDLWARTPRYLLEAIARVVSQGRIARKNIELVLVGELSPADRAMIGGSPAARQARMLGYRTHAQSVAWLRSADLLFLPLHVPLDGRPALVVPGKTYEYLASGRPILAMGPPGDMRRFVQETRSGVTVDGADVEGAVRAIEAVHRAKLSGRPASDADGQAISRFERRRLAARLAEELDETIERCRLRTAVAVGAASAADLP